MVWKLRLPKSRSMRISIALGTLVDDLAYDLDPGLFSVYDLTGGDCHGRALPFSRHLSQGVGSAA